MKYLILIFYCLSSVISAEDFWTYSYQNKSIAYKGDFPSLISGVLKHDKSTMDESEPVLEIRDHNAATRRYGIQEYYSHKKLLKADENGTYKIPITIDIQEVINSFAGLLKEEPKAYMWVIPADYTNDTMKSGFQVIEAIGKEQKISFRVKWVDSF